MQSNTIKGVTTVAQLAINKMIELEVPADPINYMVWFHYFADSYPDLKRTIDVLLDNNQVFDAEQCAKIYDQYFSLNTESAVLDNVSTNMEQVIRQAVKYLDEAGSNAADFGVVLSGASGELAGQSVPDGATEIIAGVLNATKQMEERSKVQEERLAAAASEVATLRNEIEVTRKEAATDGLTGIANRKSFDIKLRDTAARMMEDGEEMCLLMMDIDYFKKFNDNHGHQSGDQVLQLLAHILKDCIKGQDTAARYGGEEFCVILPHTTLKSAVHLAESIRERVARQQINNKATGEDLGAITLSIGVSKYDFGEPLSQVVARADTALYAAKNRGRNQVISEEAVGS
ncbi:MAG: GGDEF domain-containing protein [Rhodospirillaceae bacterium]|nr:GGDEF domain-containing protein [Rhodospirillaceae bacterium]MBT4589665.1 GGDEF domain-containing protein [Rhodospirillaceae bacterium]MBT4940265.1 GGDEF domain-containing protein [Rhodospirillaceae bacterium]MBT5940994.1 GGDEF domain-containing protein [Rhodospirillaceae bacterium]MBT7268422.1 GGDEF domain-containing protein [Rhodospirillaceae bacterium]